MKKYLAIFLAVAMIFTMAACGKQEEPQPQPQADIFAKSEGVMTYAEYAAAATDTEVTVEGFIQSCSYNAAYGNASMFLQDKDGGYYVYRINVAADQADKLVKGAKLKVTGYKTEWAGEVEIDGADATYEVLEGSYVAEPIDATYDFYEEGLKKYPNQLVKVSGVQVEPSIDANGDVAPFLYNWDGSGTQGSDLYFNVSFHDNVFNLTVETDECPADSAVYKAVEGLKIGDVIDFESFIYWYYGPNPHVQSVKVTKQGEGAVSAKAFREAAVDTQVTVEGYVTKAAHNLQYGNVSFYMQDAECGYYVYRMPITEEEAMKIDRGTKIRVTGYKTEWSGEVEIDGADATYEILDGEYKPAAYDVTALLGTDNLIKHMNKYVAFKDVKIEPSKDPAGNDVPFLYNWDGSGAAGSNCDLYFNVSVNDHVYNLTVESDECPEGSETYELASQFQIGDVVTLEGMLYWYNGANPHITKVLTK